MKQQYISYQKTIEFLNKAMGDYPDLIRLQSIGETWEGRPIMLVTISNDVAYANEKPALLYTGTIHAREWIGIELATQFVQYVIDHYKTNPKLFNALTRNTLYMVPCLNPDGFEYSRRHFSFWRKNRRDNGDGTFGVDLNRNFSVRFRKSQDTSSNIYGGPEPFSEPETRAIKEFVDQHPNITVALDYHSQGNVFFPAHKFNHEEEVEGTDLNQLCANMASEINKVTGRQYGIHRGKPPLNLINGSGREYYYNRGILATVVEVGTRNIPDYLINMKQSVDENIPAVLYALESAINYSPKAPARVSGFLAEKIGMNEVCLKWEHESQSDCFFEIYRTPSPKHPCTNANRVAITRAHSHRDIQLNSGQRYFYTVRVVDRASGIKSPFTPALKLKTLLADDEFSHTLFPARSDVGYVGEKTPSLNSKHFGYNSLFVGVNRNKGHCLGVIAYNLENLPADTHIKTARFSLYPMNRVNAKIEKYGEWSVSILDASEISDLTSYEQIASATVIQTLGDAIPSDQLTQGIWTEWDFTGTERRILQQQIASGRIILRIEGPSTLPRGHDSQMMQFDIGYGRFGAGIHYRPSLEIIYTRASQQLNLEPENLHTIAREKVVEGELKSGFDSHGDKVYGHLSFNLDQLPDPEKTVVTEAYVELKAKNRLQTRKDIRFTIEMAELEEMAYDDVLNRQQIEYIGYEVSNTDLKANPAHCFMFDSYCRQILEQLHSRNMPVYLIVRPTTPSQERNAIIDWHGKGENWQAKLVIKYIERRKKPLTAPTELTATLDRDSGRVRLTWKQPDDPDFVGCYVVRNRFHPPRSPLDGVKLYGGKDEYTLDDFGNPNIAKYYSVFSYDNVPNYSAPATVLFSLNEVIPVLEDEDYETQEDEEERLSRSEESEEALLVKA
ncbi:M14 family zinc carboxypeptidase [Endozoicomonas gorgoniicola]|uniref:M14 family zinc carboxypeptidase n=1 Tax=Endozoicomonas gorgoniicola TaxID=1234144 RepID=A0ABT3N4C1_9GAMM|nr:M14 family zinc carboxypeptidase [Endozoicomonas gorgoniicola]MCW7556183.1 M14 family zinc carboxypeptidase [Endozoicomonas gorgoniicola]